MFGIKLESKSDGTASAISRAGVVCGTGNTLIIIYFEYYVYGHAYDILHIYIMDHYIVMN